MNKKNNQITKKKQKQSGEGGKKSLKMMENDYKIYTK